MAFDDYKIRGSHFFTVLFHGPKNAAVSNAALRKIPFEVLESYKNSETGRFETIGKVSGNSEFALKKWEKTGEVKKVDYQKMSLNPKSRSKRRKIKSTRAFDARKTGFFKDIKPGQFFHDIPKQYYAVKKNPSDKFRRVVIKGDKFFVDSLLMDNKISRIFIEHAGNNLVYDIYAKHINKLSKLLDKYPELQGRFARHIKKNPNKKSIAFDARLKKNPKKKKPYSFGRKKETHFGIAYSVPNNAYFVLFGKDIRSASVLKIYSTRKEAEEFLRKAEAEE